MAFSEITVTGISTDRKTLITKEDNNNWNVSSDKHFRLGVYPDGDT